MVHSFLGLLEKRYREGLDERANEYINFAVDGADRMKDMIRSLLEFARVETKGQPFEETDLDLVLSNSMTNIKLLIDESGAVISSEFLPTVLVDPAQMMQVFQNLISNAIKFHSSETPKIDIFSREEEGHWVIGFRDNGIGIDPQQHERICGVFYPICASGRRPISPLATPAHGRRGKLL